MSRKIAETMSRSQDGEDPAKRTDMLSERKQPGRHGGSGTQVKRRRPQNREVEDEMVKVPRREGEPPVPATEPDSS